MTNNSRGVRNCNPGNIERTNPPTKWQGLADVQSDPRFVTFAGMAWGVRAMARTIITYQDKHGCNTVQKIINRWAPPNENHTTAYIAAVAGAVGVPPTQAINVHDYAVMRPLLDAMIAVECARYVVDDAVMIQGLTMAGVVPPAAPLYSTRTMKGAAVAVVAAAAPYVPEALAAVGGQSDTLRALAAHWPLAGGLATFAVLCGVFAMVWARIDDRRKLQR